MKECMEQEKHKTCEHRCWDASGKNMCNTWKWDSCKYEPNFIRFEDVSDEEIMYSGDIESTDDFRTKSEWIKEFGIDGFLSERESSWHTTKTSYATIDISQLIEHIDESQEMHENWIDCVDSALSDEVVLAGINRLNEIFSNHPTYWENKLIIFGTIHDEA